MMKILTIQDISCIGQCSLTVALPILSMCGWETCILPSAVLSTHTAFPEFVCHDLTETMPDFTAHWKKENIKFDAFYTGYLGNEKQIAFVRDIFQELGTEQALTFVDPAMADNGKLYPAFDLHYAEAMKELCFQADVILPNLTEACLLTDTPYQEQYDSDFIDSILKKLKASGAKIIILTGIGYTPDTTGVMIAEEQQAIYYSHKKLKKGCHGTGDIYASVFTGAYLHSRNIYQAAKLAADFTLQCIENTVNDPSHWYGVNFETVLPSLANNLK